MLPRNDRLPHLPPDMVTIHEDLILHHIANALAVRLGYSDNSAKMLVRQVFAEIKSQLIAGKSIDMREMGLLAVRIRGLSYSPSATTVDKIVRGRHGI